MKFDNPINPKIILGSIVLLSVLGVLWFLASNKKPFSKASGTELSTNSVIANKDNPQASPLGRVPSVSSKTVPAATNGSTARPSVSVNIAKTSASTGDGQISVR